MNHHNTTSYPLFPDLYWKDTTPPPTFYERGQHLNNRKRWKRLKRRSHHTSPNKSRRQSARKGFRMGQ